MGKLDNITVTAQAEHSPKQRTFFILFLRKERIIPNEKITFNRSDWTSREATLTANKNEFVLDGMPDELSSWFLRPHSRDHELIVISNTKRNLHYHGNFFRGKYYFNQFGVEREDKNPMVAFAQLMWNLV